MANTNQRIVGLQIFCNGLMWLNGLPILISNRLWKTVVPSFHSIKWPFWQKSMAEWINETSNIIITESLVHNIHPIIFSSWLHLYFKISSQKTAHKWTNLGPWVSGVHLTEVPSWGQWRLTNNAVFECGHLCKESA